MLETENVKAYYFFDEAGDPQVLGRKGKKDRPCIRLGFFRNAWHAAHFHLNRIYQ